MSKKRDRSTRRDPKQFGEAAPAVVGAGPPPPPPGPPSHSPRLLNAKQLADRLQVTPRRIMEGVKIGEIPSIPLGPKMHRFDYEEVIQTLKSRRERGE